MLTEKAASKKDVHIGQLSCSAYMDLIAVDNTASYMEKLNGYLVYI